MTPPENEKMKQPQFNVCSVCKQPFKDDDVIGSCLCGKHEGPHHLGCDHIENEKMKWWEDDKYQKLFGDKETFVYRTYDIPAIIAESQRLTVRQNKESLRSTLEYMKANPLPTHKKVSIRNQGWNEAVDYLLNRLKSL